MMKIKYDLLAVAVVAIAILIAGAIEFSIENYSEELPVTDSECEEYYGISVEESVEDLGLQSGMTEGWGTEGEAKYLEELAKYSNSCNLR